MNICMMRCLFNSLFIFLGGFCANEQYKNLLSSIFDNDDLGRGVCCRKNCDGKLTSDFSGVFSFFWRKPYSFSAMAMERAACPGSNEKRLGAACVTRFNGGIFVQRLLFHRDQICPNRQKFVSDCGQCPVNYAICGAIFKRKNNCEKHRWFSDGVVWCGIYYYERASVNFAGAWRCAD